MLDLLGKALKMSDLPWSNLSQDSLQEMLKCMIDLTNVGFKLKCLDSCINRIRDILDVETNRPQMEEDIEKIS